MLYIKLDNPSLLGWKLARKKTVGAPASCDAQQKTEVEKQRQD